MLKTVSSITNAIGALNYKGTWNASTNTPALASGVGTKGDYYVVSVSGSTALDGISNWGVGDWAVFNGSAWQRVEGGADLNGVNLSVSGTSSLGGDATLVSGNLVVGTAGKGVDFSADAHAAGMTSELLDDYEEGTWTPGPGNLTVVGAFSSSGTYTKVGRLVTVTATLAGATSIAGGAGQFFTGLPYAPAVVAAGSLVLDNRSTGCLVQNFPTTTNVYINGGFPAHPAVHVTLSYIV